MATASAPTITKMGTQEGTDRTIYATWEWKKDHTKEYRCVWFYFTGDGVWYVGSDTTEKYKQSTYTAPDNATRVRFKVKPISDTHKVNNVDTSYFVSKFSKTQEYKMAWSPPAKAATPDVSINSTNSYQLDMSLSNIDETWTADGVEFEIYTTDNPKKTYAKQSVRITKRYAGCSVTIEPGYRYKVRCRGIKYDKKGFVIEEGDWSDFSSEVDTIPMTITQTPIVYALSPTSMQVGWDKLSNATSYDIEYTTQRSHFDTSSDEVKTVSVESTVSTAIINGLSGGNYWVRVRGVNNIGNGGWSPITGILIGQPPAAPTTWSSTTTATIGDELTLYWIHNSKDGSTETYAEIELTINGTTTSIELENSVPEWSKESTRSYKLDVSSYTEGAKIQWRVRTAGASRAVGDWSALREITVYAKPTLSVSVIGQNGNQIYEVESFPFYIIGTAGPSTQTPIGFHIEVTADSAYETVDQIGNTVYVSAGDSVYSKYYNTSSNLVLELNAGNVDLENGISYTVTVTVSMNTGLVATSSTRFVVGWEYTMDEPNAEVGYDSDTYSCNIRPYCTDENDTLVEGVLLSVYRREFDGGFVEIASGLTNSGAHYVTDPHPSLDFARYRIIATSISTGEISYCDLPGYPIGEKAAIIQWNDKWSEFDASSNDESDETETPAWSGSLIRLPYNLDVSDKTDPDVSLVNYIGRKRSVSYYGTQLGETSSWKMDVIKGDTDTLYALRRLAIWMGDVYVREPSGSGYWANIKVSFSQTHKELVIPVTLEITRVEGGV